MVRAGGKGFLPGVRAMFRYGACYFPERWTAEQVAEHVKLMTKARFNVVRLGSGAWCKFEPEAGRFKFAWLDPVIADLNKAGIATVMCTPTAVAPMWMHVKHPRILRVNRHGHARVPGSPHACCVNAPEFQMQTDAIALELGKHYGKMDGVIGWQIDDALLPTDDGRCYCEHCEKAFRQWLLAKYQTTDAVNEAWGTSAWGGDVRQWNEIPLPRGTAHETAAGHWLDFARFTSDSRIAFHRRQAALIRPLSPDRFIVHAATPSHPAADPEGYREHADFSAGTNFPGSAADPYATSYNLAVVRGNRGNFWIMAQQCGPILAPGRPALAEGFEPGQLRRWVWQAVANGANGLCYLPWSSAIHGRHQEWAGLIEHFGRPRQRFREALATREELVKAAAAIEDTRIESKVAVLRTQEVFWSWESRPSVDEPAYEDRCRELYRAVRRTGHTCDVIGKNDEFKKYGVILAPMCMIVDAELVERLEAWVKGGGMLLLTPHSGTRTPANALYPAPSPGLFAPLAGVSVEEVVTCPPERGNTLNFARGGLIAQQCPVHGWLEVLKCELAEALGEYVDGRLKGKPAISRRVLDNGQVYYVGAYLARNILELFIADLLRDYPVKSIPEGVEFSQRKGPNGRIVFAINHTAERQELKLPGKFTELISGETIGPSVKLSAHGILVLQA